MILPKKLYEEIFKAVVFLTGEKQKKMKCFLLTGDIFNPGFYQESVSTAAEPRFAEM